MNEVRKKKNGSKGEKKSATNTITEHKIAKYNTTITIITINSNRLIKGINLPTFFVSHFINKYRFNFRFECLPFFSPRLPMFLILLLLLLMLSFAVNLIFFFHISFSNSLNTGLVAM